MCAVCSLFNVHVLTLFNFMQAQLMAAQQDNNHSQQKIKELEDEIQNYRVSYRYVSI